MKGLVYYGAKDIRYETHDDPKLAADTDVIVKISACSICGSDLHIYHGHGFSADTGFCVGHESVGEVVEAGRSVRRLKVGDRVMLSAAVGCGMCGPCMAGKVELCRTGMLGCYGLGKALEGGQAEAIRVPMADINAAPIPEGLSDAQALMLTDNLPTAWFGLRHAEIKPGQQVVAVGLGPIGLMAVEGAFVKGASKVYAVDLNPARRAIAQGLGAVAVSPEEARDVVTAGSGGLMADCAVEAVGADATIQLAISLVGRGGRVSVVGVNQNMDFRFPMAMGFFKGLHFSIGVCGVQQYWDELVPLIQQGRLKPERFISHTLPLSDGAKAYDLFDTKADGALKMVLEV
jgi:2-desacetyl-2-hydroxyethyl bacteriochlorophyllide A dehydrogenase